MKKKCRRKVKKKNAGFNRNTTAVEISSLSLTRLYYEGLRLPPPPGLGAAQELF